jgi:TusA-related sulfurtransferase
MKNEPRETEGKRIDFFLDITGETCPLTFVKTKLVLEKMAPGQIVEVRLKGREPLDNLPRVARDQGHQVLSFLAEDPAGPAEGAHRLLIRKVKA